MVKTRNGNNYGTDYSNTNTDDELLNDDNNNQSNDGSIKRNERSIEIDFFSPLDGKGACKYKAMCPQCPDPVYFDNIQGWRDHHEAEHHKEVGYQCPECDRKSQNWYNYTNHVQTHDSVAPAWNCIIDSCNTPFANIYSLLSHWKKYHTQYKIRKIPSKSTIADDLRMLMGTYDESGGEQAEGGMNGTPKRRKKKKRKKRKSKKRGCEFGNLKNKKRRKLNNQKKQNRYSNDSDYLISSNECETSEDDDIDLHILNGCSMVDSIKKLNEIMNDCPQQKVDQKSFNGIDLLLKAVEIVGDGKNNQTNSKQRDIQPNTIQNNNNLFRPCLPNLGSSWNSSSNGSIDINNAKTNCIQFGNDNSQSQKKHIQNDVNYFSNSPQHQIRAYPTFINAAQPNYQTIGVPINQLSQFNQFNGLNQPYAIVQNPNKPMVAVTIVPKQQINSIPIIFQPPNQRQHQPSVLQFNQNFNNNQMMNVQNIAHINNHQNNTQNILSLPTLPLPVLTENK